MATVKGDIHDIGKNIVKVLLDNYGYTVVDLGLDVDPRIKFILSAKSGNYKNHPSTILSQAGQIRHG